MNPPLTKLMSTLLPYRWASDETALATANGVLSSGCTATSGTKEAVFAIAAWAASQTSIDVLSL